MSDEFALKLLGQFALHRGEEVVELPPACQRLIALVALKRRPVHRLWVCAMLWPHAQTRRAIASLRSTMWRLRPVGADPLLEVDPQYIALASDVSVDWHDAADQIEHLLDADAPVDPQFVADLLPLLRAGELLDGWSEPWAHAERQRYRAIRKAARDALSGGSEKQVAAYACGSMRSAHTLHSVRKSKND
ncbi:transcriptional regulator [Mycobacterium sp. ACS1612]|uniref:AfsR/SARP family transcriptional regulator n=1 Tax=Mycobacterium sp. ACS1612 TaxID=1834117 RepID=UPI0007FB9470|nr:transcriptional regulator [Mycobacterium sp. ACS1612]OBF31295.1 transcriptional regulator [Mycobacterium sp. ACS1612]